MSTSLLAEAGNKTASISALSALKYSATAEPKKGGSTNMLAMLGSRQNLLKEAKSRNKANAQQYKQKRLAEGLESEREPDITGIMKWEWSKREDSEVHSIKFSSDSEYLVSGLGNGNISVYSMHTNSKEFTLKPDMKLALPCTGIAFRPDNEKFRTRNVFAATYSDGSIRHWHAPSGKLVSTIREKDSDLQCLNVSYQANGEKFVVAGSDNNIRVYDGFKHQKIYSSKNIEENGPIGHTNRIYCSKFHPKLPGIIISGGWDDTLQVWDIRAPNPVRRIFSPRICGDSIDFNEAGTLILTGSYRKDDQLQTWDWETGKLMDTISWTQDAIPPLAMVYTSQYSHSNGRNKYILAGASGSINEVKLFSTESKKILGVLHNMNCAIYTTAMSGDEKFVAVGGGGKLTTLMQIDEEE